MALQFRQESSNVLRLDDDHDDIGIRDSGLGIGDIETKFPELIGAFGSLLRNHDRPSGLHQGAGNRLAHHATTQNRDVIPILIVGAHSGDLISREPTFMNRLL